MARGLSCSSACGIFPNQGLNPCPLHWQADSYPLHHQEGPSDILNARFLNVYMMGHGEAQSLGLDPSSYPGTQASDTYLVTLTHHPLSHGKGCLRDMRDPVSCYPGKLPVSCSNLLITDWVQSPHVEQVCCGQGEGEKYKAKKPFRLQRGELSGSHNPSIQPLT